MNVKRLIFASLILVALLFACEPPGGPAIGGGGDVEDPTPTPEPTTEDGYILNLSALLDGSETEFSFDVSPDKAVYEKGEEIEISIPFTPGYEFINWTGDIDPLHSDSLKLSIAINSNINLVANFDTVRVVNLNINDNFKDSNNSTINLHNFPQNDSIWIITPLDSTLIAEYDSFTVLNSTTLSTTRAYKISLLTPVPGFSFSDIEFTNESTKPLMFPGISPNTFYIYPATTEDLELSANFIRNDDPFYYVNYFINDIDINGADKDLIEGGSISVTPIATDTFNLDEPTEIVVTTLAAEGFTCSNFQANHIFGDGKNSTQFSQDNDGNYVFTLTVDQPLNIMVEFTPIQ